MHHGEDRIWMKVSDDEYELPEAIANTADELAKICGVTGSTVRSMVSHCKGHPNRHSRYLFVIVREEDDERKE